MVVNEATRLDIVITKKTFEPTGISTYGNFKIGDREPPLIANCNLQSSKSKQKET
jgi:hypothetical protein